MRILVTSAAALIAGSLVLGLDAGTANAGPLPAMSALSIDASVVETVGWRERYYRRNGVWPRGPRRAVDDDVLVAPIGGDDVVIIAPPRPRSCGEFRYWNGVACVDARYNDPYLGPK
ncbi:MAG TPA: hypothetical protein VMW68_01500 [Methyloceanibacter sp.]|nr:hypothetical protein [Methyloceanibacter sp.]